MVREKNSFPDIKTCNKIQTTSELFFSHFPRVSVVESTKGYNKGDNNSLLVRTLYNV